MSYPQTAHCTALQRAARWPIFLADNCSVCLKLDGQLSEMITLCIKHAAVSNSSFPPSVFPLFRFSLPLRSDGRRTSHLGNLQDFYTHGGGMYTLLLLLFLSLDPTHTRTHAHRRSFSSSHSYCRSTLDGLKECAGVERDSNCREC